MTLVLDHVGIAVEDLDSALEFWRDQLGAICSEVETVAEQGARVAFLETGVSSKTELLEATRADSPIAKFLAAGRKGVHHLAYRVDNLESRLSQLAKDGVPLIHEAPVSGSRGSRVAFLHPRGAGGVLIELVEYPET